MNKRSWLAVALAAGPVVGTSMAPLPRPAHAFASFSSAIRGDFPPPPCGVTRGDDDPGLPLESFEESTPENASNGSGTFEIEVATTCVAPFYQALFAQESLDVRFAFTDADRRPVGESLALSRASLTHVDVIGTPLASVPSVRIGIAAGNVVAGDRKAITRRRDRMPSYRGARSERFDEDANGETWVRGGVPGVSVRLASSAPSMSAAFVAAEWNLSVRAPRHANGSAAATLRVTLDRRVRIDAAERDQLDAAAQARAALSRALFEVVNAQGTSGITIRLKGASFARADRTSTRRTIELAARQLTVTDLASGRTASTP